MTRVRRAILGLAVLAALAVAAVACSGEDQDPESSPPSTAAETARADERSLQACEEVADADAARDCYAQALAALFEGEDDPAGPLEEAAVAAYSDPTGRLLGDCHGLMHTVGREFAAEHDVTLASLMTFLPQSNEPGCTAGFAHGLVTGVAPQIDLSRPADSAAVCDETDTRYQRYSCVHGFGHAFMRLVREDLDGALQLCAALGDVSAPDCSQGAFHDYWFAVIGADDTEPPDEVVDDPRELCGAQDPQFVRPCWYRAFVDDRPDQPVDGVEDIEALCTGLDGLQRQACITAASVVGPPDPSAQLAICTELEGEDAVSCIRGTKVQNLLATAAPEDLVALIRQCDGFPGATKAECYRWLGKVLAVLTDGAFEDFGCGSLPDAVMRRACVEGVRSMNGALETFS
jgi:hypothetical protein